MSGRGSQFHTRHHYLGGGIGSDCTLGEEDRAGIKGHVLSQGDIYADQY